MSDPVIERLEAELRESQFKPWDVETLLVNRHQAKIAALTKPSEKPSDKWRRGWQVAQEVGIGILAFIGFQAIMAIGGLWLLTGEFPLP